MSELEEFKDELAGVIINLARKYKIEIDDLTVEDNLMGKFGNENMIRAEIIFS